MKKDMLESEDNEVYAPHLRKETIGFFYRQIEKKNYKFDKNGLLVVKQFDPDYPTYAYNPIGIANYALFRFNDLVKNTDVFNTKTDPKNSIMNSVRWLIANRKDERDMSSWYFDYPFSAHGCVPPWKSAMTQGLILSLFLRIARLTNDYEYRRLAARVANSLKRTTSDGGFLYVDHNGDYWYEEYMGNCGHVLNGFVYAMLGVYEYSQFCKDYEFRDF